MQPKNKEIEIKFEVKDLGKIAEKLKHLNAVEKIKRHFEDNIVFDNELGDLQRRGCLLRLRKDFKQILTFKTGMEYEAGPKTDKIKHRDEFEIEISNFDTTIELLAHLGYKISRRYQKYRSVWQLGNVEVMLDELPFANFVEVEGAEADIMAVIKLLELKFEERVTPADNVKYDKLWKEKATFN